jgi:hypothetical protein
MGNLGSLGSYTVKSRVRPRRGEGGGVVVMAASQNTPEKHGGQESGILAQTSVS